MKARVNLLCIAGAALGLASLLVPFVEISGEGEYVLWDILQQPALYGTGFVLGITLFVLGAGMAFVTPASGFVEFAGVMIFLYYLPEAYRNFSGNASLALGAYIAIISTVIVAVSLFMPLGTGYPRKRRFWNESLGSASRFLTVSPFDVSAKLRVNLLCLAGALLAFAGIAMPWVSTTDIMFVADTTEQHSDSLLAFVGGQNLEIGAFIFIFGTVAALLTPAASLAQLMGFYWMYTVLSPLLDFAQTRTGLHEVALGLGFYMGLIGAIMVAFSLFIPMGLGFFGRWKGLGGHLIAWGTPGKPKGIPLSSLIS